MAAKKKKDLTLEEMKELQEELNEQIIDMEIALAVEKAAANGKDGQEKG